VLDLGGVSSATPQIISAAVRGWTDACTSAGVDWSLVASQSVTRAVRTFDDRLELPTVATVADALNQFADAMLETPSAPSAPHQ